MLFCAKNDRFAELLAKSEDDQYEHRSVIAAADSDLARISRSDFEDMIEKFPEVHTDLKAIGQADLDDVTSMVRFFPLKITFAFGFIH